MMLITSAGEHRRLAIDPTSPTSLAELQDAVNGQIEIIGCAGGVLIVNQEGGLLGLPVNAFASHLAGLPIVGPAVFCDSETFSRMPRA
jgi:hypothetical protein